MLAKERLNLLRVELWLLKASGLLPPADKNISSWKKGLYGMYTMASFLSYIPAFLGQFFAVYHYRGNVEMLVELTYQLSGTLNTFALGASLYFNRKKYIQLFNHLEEGFVNHMQLVCPAECRHSLITKSLKRASILTWTLIGTNSFTLISWISAPPYYRYTMQLDNRTEVSDEQIEHYWQYFTWISWLPPNALEHPKYDYIWMYQAYVIYVTIAFFTCYLTLSSAVLIYTSMNFQILTAAIIKMSQAEQRTIEVPSKNYAGETFLQTPKNVNIAPNSLHEINKSRRTMEKQVKDGRELVNLQTQEMESVLIDWVKYHQSLLSFCEDLKQAFSSLHFIFFIVNLSCTCMSAFQFAMGSAGHKGLKFFAASVNAWIPLLIICLHGEHLTTQSTALYHAVCGSQWYNQSPRFRRMMLMIITVSQKPVCFIAGKFYTVSLEAFGQMLATERLNLLRVELWLLKASGLLPPADKTISSWKKGLYGMYTMATFLSYIPAFLGQFFAVYHYRDNIEILVELIYQLLSMINTFALGASLYFNRKKYIQLFNHLEEGFVNHMERVCPAECRYPLITKSLKRASILTWTLIGTNSFTLISWISAPPYYRYTMQLGNRTEVSDEEMEHYWQYFTWISWLPPNVLEHPKYEYIWMYQAYVVYVVLAFFTCYLTLGSTVLIYTSMNFQILTAAMDYMKISHAEQRTTEVPSRNYVRETFLQTTKNVNIAPSSLHEINKSRWTREKEVKDANELVNLQTQEMESVLINWVKYHQNLLSFCEDLKQAFSTLHFIFFILSLCCTCMSAFQFVVGSAGHKGLKFFAASVNSWVPLLIICLHGEYLTTQSTALYHAVCGSQWYNQSPRFKRMMLMIITASQEPVYFIAGKFYTVSLETFGQMTNTVYAYFTVLMQMVDND